MGTSIIISRPDENIRVGNLGSRHCLPDPSQYPGATGVHLSTHGQRNIAQKFAIALASYNAI
jgi:hypothetical protein